MRECTCWILVLTTLLLCALIDRADSTFVFQTLDIISSPHNCPQAHCKHGGLCNVTSQLCACPPGYAGKLCEYPVCTVACQNNGTCVGPNHCKCPAGLRGRQCQECTRSQRQQCPRDPSCSVYENSPNVCCPPCRYRHRRANCSPGSCQPKPGCSKYTYNRTSNCCPKCVQLKQQCLGSVCELETGCMEHALKVGRGTCCPRCARYRCTGVECPVVADCIKFAPTVPGQCCPTCVARRASCPGANCTAVPNCAAYTQRSNQCCAHCKRLKQRARRIDASNICSTSLCPAVMDCYVKDGKPSCRCKRGCPKKKRPVCGSDGHVHRNRCRMLRTACLKGMSIQPAPLPFCTYYGPRIQKTLANLRRMMSQTNSGLKPITLLGSPLQSP